MSVSKLLSTASGLALQAAEALTHLRQKPLVQERKADRSWVTNADHACDRILREGLHAAFPSHAILTEESGWQGAVDAEYVWVIDPIDGTRAFMRGVPGYSVMVGLLHHGEPCLGVIVDPVESRLYEAVRGEGAFLTHSGQRTRLAVSSRTQLSHMPVVTSTGFPTALQSTLSKVLCGPWLSPINSVGIKVGCLVRQEADIYVNHHRVHYWDTLAPQVVLHEAGGTISLISGEPLRYPMDNHYVHPVATLATHGVRHEEIRAAIAPLLPVPAAH